MNLVHKLSSAVLERHPRDAAAILEGLPVEDVAALLQGVSPAVAAAVVGVTAPHTISTALQRLDVGVAAAIIEHVPVDLAAVLLRGVGAAERARLVEALPREHGRWLTAALGSRPGTAAALMDPTVLVLHEDRTVEEAMGQVQRWPERALYNLYVVDQDHRLRGVLNLQELMRAHRGDRLSEVMHPAEHRIPADFGVRAIIEHAGWRAVYSLPVVDPSGVFIGAVRYRTLRLLETQTRHVAEDPGAATVEALASLFWSGVGGMIEAVATSVPGGRSPATPPERG